MASDIGVIIFRDVLKMNYPGFPFTGDIVTDLVQFLLVPSIFLIIVIYLTVGRIIVHEHQKLRLLLGIGMYLFILTGGYYSVFALLAGPYFLILIFVLGLLYFFLEHFRRGNVRAVGEGGGRGGAGGVQGPPHSQYESMEYMNRDELKERKQRVEDLIAEIHSQIRAAEKRGEMRDIGPMRHDISRLNAELREIKRQLRFVKIG